VAKGQWEFQIFGKGSKKAADEMWMARYLLLRLTENTASTSNSTASRSATPTGTAPACTPTSRPPIMREVGGKEYFEKLMAAFDKNRTITSRSTVRTITCA
jgi:glutamine synthetase